MDRSRRIKKLLYCSAASALLFVAPSVLAAPQGGVVSDGSANITHSGKKTDIHQSTNKAIIDWQSFNIAGDEHTQFHQPSSGSVTLNRIHDVDPSKIDGRLTANGHVMLINPNGVVFGAGSKVDVGSLTATTADIKNADFMAGDYKFDKAGQIDASIINRGHITAREAGLVNLVAPIVENKGVILAKLGKVQVAAADTFSLDMAGDGLIQVAVSHEDAKKLASNSGTITAEGGTIAMTAARARNIVDSLVMNSGIITASSMTHRGGKVVLGASTVKVSGAIKADGKTGGGEILVGGDLQRKTINNVETAQKTLVTQDATITANAMDTGDGGKVIIWADDATYAYGHVEAKGGSNGGDGGFAEISGKSYLDFRGTVDLSGDHLGTLLLDPDDLDIVAGATNPGEFADDTIAFAENGGGTSTLGADTISTRLTANANVVLQANNTIDVNAAITSTGDGNLTMQTGNGGVITVNQAIDVNTGDLTLRADEIDLNAGLTGSGDIQLTSADANQAIEIGSSSAGDLNLTAAELGNLTNGWNSITIGGTDHTAPITVNEAVSFSDHAYLRNDTASGGQDYQLDINANITTLDNSDLFLYGRANATSTHPWVGVHISSGLDVARDLTIDTQWDVLGLSGNTVVGRDFNLTSGANSVFYGDITIDRNLSIVHQSASPANFLRISSGRIVDVGGDVNFTATHSSSFDMQANSVLEADGNITITSPQIDLDATAQIRSGSGTSNLTFLETGQNNDMELGGTSHGATWQMEASEIDTIQEGFNAITFGSSSHTGGIIFTDSVSFSDDLIVRQDQASATAGIDRSASRITTTDSANASFYSAQYGMYNFSADIAGDLLFDGFQAVGASDLDVGGDVTLQNISNDFVLHSSSTHNIGGDLTANLGARYRHGVGASAALNVDGNVDITSNSVLFISGSSITGNAAGNITIRSNEDIDLDTVTLTSVGGGNITLNADRDNNNDGFIRLLNSTITTNGGNFTAGGGLNPLTDYAWGNATRDDGLTVSNTDITTGAGNISLYGHGRDHAAASYQMGVFINGGSTLNTTTGNIALNGIGGAGDDSNRGIYVGNIGTLITSASGAISLTGQGGGTGAAGSNGNDGIHIQDHAKITSTGTGSGAATITLHGTSANGDSSNRGVYIEDANTEITSIDGAIDITGVARSNGIAASNSNHGVLIYDGASVESTGTTTDAATITIDGTGGAGQTGNRGVYIGTANTLVTSAYGAIDITGRGGANGAVGSINNQGVLLLNGGQVTSSGTGTNAATITIDGTGGAGVDSNVGVFISGTNSEIISTDGNVSVTGRGNSNGIAGSASSHGIILSVDGKIRSIGTTTDAATITIDGTGGAGEDSNVGVYATSSGVEITSVMGAIDITGQGGGTGAAGSNGNYGVYFLDGADVTSTGTGANAATITIDGTGGAGEDQNRGVYLIDSGTTITSVDGAIDITGQGGSNGIAGSVDNYGIIVNTNSQIASTGTGANAATITLNGTGANGEDTNIGTYLVNNALVTSVDGDISITGTAGSNGSGLSNNNYGLMVAAGADVTSTGTTTDAATITLQGTGGSGDDYNYGVYMNNTGTTISSVIGAIDITGQGGSNGLTTSERNYGVYVTGNGVVSSTGTGANAATITVDGTGADGQNRNDGIRIGGGTTTAVTSVDGAMSLTGQGGSNGDVDSDTNIGVYVVSNGEVSSTGTGANAATITIDGTGGAGDDGNRGVLVQNTGSTVTSAEGAIQITGRGNTHGIGSNTSNNSIDIRDDGTVSTTAATTDITFIGDDFYIDGTGAISSTGNVTVRAITDSTTIGLAGGTGDLNLTDAELARFTVGNTFVFGNSAAGTGAVDIDGWDFSAGSYGVGIYGGSITGDEIVAGTNALTLGARTGDISLTSNTNLDYTSGNFTTQGGNIILNADRDANNTGGIRLVNGTINTNGGNFTAGGGANPLTTAAHGMAGGYDYGVNLNNTDVTTGAGNITIRGEGEDVGNGNHGIVVQAGSTLTTTTGNITLDGQGGTTAGEQNNGVHFGGVGTIVTSADGDISITGRGGSDGTAGSKLARGIYVASGSHISSTGTGAGAATITLNGTGGNGEDSNYGIIAENNSLITSVDGNISLTGQGGTNGTDLSNNNYGIVFANGSDITSTGTTSDAATITLDGTGGAGESANIGIQFQNTGTTLSSVMGNVSLTGRGGSNGSAGSATNHGIQVVSESRIMSTGAGVNAATITLDGTAGAGEDANRGLSLGNANTEITSVDGAISITGRGGSNGNAGSTDNHGILLNDSFRLTSTGTGTNAATITMNGTAGNGEDINVGTYIANSGFVSSVDGAIDITGRGGSNGIVDSDLNYGVSISNLSTVSSTGTGANAATITIDATAGDGEDSNHGFLTGGNSIVTSVDGAIDITGRGGSNGSDLSTNNYGVVLANGIKITSTGTTSDAATITLDGTGGAGEASNYGVQFQNTNTLLSSVMGNVDITGRGGSNGTSASNYNYGVNFQSEARLVSTGTGVGAATVTIDGTGGNGEVGNHGVVLNNANTEIASVDGAIDITGRAGTNGASNSQNTIGVFLVSGAEINSTGTGANAATITLDGTAAAALRDNRGITINNASLNSVDGNISLTGRGGSNGNSGSVLNYGLFVHTGSKIRSTGTGVNAATITLDGTAGAGEDNNRGVSIESATTEITSVDGDISVTGQGGSNGNAGSTDNHGLLMSAGALITSTGTGVNAATITLDGTGGAGEDANNGTYISGNGASTGIRSVDGAISITGTAATNGIAGSFQNRGILIDNTAHVTSTGTGVNAATITLDGTGGAGEDDNYGVVMNNAIVTSADGAIDVTGRGGSNGTANSVNGYGVYVHTGAQITSTGTGVNAATITLDGAGGGGDDYNYGVLLTVGNAEIVSVDGAIDITGRAGSNSLATSDFNSGILLSSTGRIRSTGTGVNAATITLDGTGGNGRDGNRGVMLRDNNTLIQSAQGDVSITGQGLGNRTSNYGFYSILNADIDVNNGASLTINGTGSSASGATNGDGVRMDNAGTSITAENGDITLVGTALRNETTADGVLLYDGAFVSTTGTGNIDVTGRTAGLGNGIRILNNNSNITHTGIGNVTVTGSGSTSGNDIVATHGQINTSGGTGSNVTLTGDSLVISGTGDLDASGSLTINPYTNSTTIGLGGGAGSLNIDDTELSLLSTSKLTIGSTSSTGLMTIDSVDVSGGGYALDLYGGGIAVNNGLTGGDEIFMQSNAADIRLNSGTVTGVGANNTLVLNAYRNFVNSAGASALDAGAGRYLVYGSSLNSITRDGLTGGNLYNRTYVNTPPASVTQTGDQFIYSAQPMLRFTADNVALDTYTPSFDDFSYSMDGLVNGDTAAQAFAGVPELSKIRRAPGRYTIRIDQGSLVSDSGYGFVLVDGRLTMEKASSQLPEAVQQQIQIAPQQQRRPSTPPVQKVPVASGVENNNAPTNGNTINHKVIRNQLADSSSNDAGIRLITSNAVEITPPVLKMFDLCNADGRYCGN